VIDIDEYGNTNLQKSTPAAAGSGEPRRPSRRRRRGVNAAPLSGPKLGPELEAAASSPNGQPWRKQLSENAIRDWLLASGFA
jgi:hypothetical protein